MNNLIRIVKGFTRMCLDYYWQTHSNTLNELEAIHGLPFTAVYKEKIDEHYTRVFIKRRDVTTLYDSGNMPTKANQHGWKRR